MIVCTLRLIHSIVFPYSLGNSQCPVAKVLLEMHCNDIFHKLIIDDLGDAFKICFDNYRRANAIVDVNFMKQMELMTIYTIAHFLIAIKIRSKLSSFNTALQ